MEEPKRLEPSNVNHEVQLLTSMAGNTNIREQQDDKETVASSTSIASSIEKSRKGWNNSKLTALHWFCPLGPCHIRVKRDELEGILKCLPSVFRQLSFDVQYENSPISATCHSMDQVELKVSCFASQTKSDEEIVVEVAHICGDSVSFHDYSQAIIGAISAMQDFDDSLNSTDSSSRLSFGPQYPAMGQGDILCPFRGKGNTQLLPAKTIIRSQDSGSRTLRKSAMEEGLEIAHNFLSTGRHDAQRHGMDVLMQMTNPSSSGWSVVVPTAEALFFPNTETQQYISHKILKWACDNDQDGVDFSSDLSDLALVVITQALQIVAESKLNLDLTTFLQTQVRSRDIIASSNSSSSIIWKNVNLLEFMMQQVHGMYSHPHRAYFAMKFLVAVCCCVPACPAKIMRYNPNFLSVVEEAQSFGDSHHLAMATASQQLLQCLVYQA